MAKTNPNQKPKFFWQGFWILLPVAVLASLPDLALRHGDVVEVPERR